MPKKLSLKIQRHHFGRMYEICMISIFLLWSSTRNNLMRKETTCKVMQNYAFRVQNVLFFSRPRCTFISKSYVHNATTISMSGFF